MKNIMTIDLEDWYHCNLGNNNVLEKRTSTVEKNTNELLRLLKKYNAKATFFTLGTIGEDFPDLIKKIDSDGHEIGSHGYGHELVYSLTLKQFREDLLKSKKILENIIKKDVVGYRAPSWSITNKNLWALEELEKAGFKYSSSIFPIKTFLYGIPDAPTYPNQPIINEKSLNIYEYPPGTANFLFKKLGFSGGFYFRFFPFFIIKWLIKKRNKKNIPVICYIHPWEIDENPPKMNLKGLNKIIHYYGIKGCKKKLEKLLKAFEFTSMANYNKDNIKKEK